MKIGFIGTGNMGSAMIKGLVTSEHVSGSDINIFDVNVEKSRELSEKYNVKPLQNEVEIADNSDVIVLSVKPNIYNSVLEKIKARIDENKIIIAIAAGISIESVENIAGKDKKVVRIMPNTPAQVLEGMTAVTFNGNVKEEEKKVVFGILDSFGKSIEIEEKLMHTFTGIAGSLPAYVYMFMEALADGGVLEGMPRDKAYEIVAQTVKGSAEMLLKTGKHPGVLKDEVTSPAGTTIEAVNTLENGNFRGTVINAVRACVEKSQKMSNYNILLFLISNEKVTKKSTNVLTIKN